MNKSNWFAFVAVIMIVAVIDKSYAAYLTGSTSNIVMVAVYLMGFVAALRAWSHIWLHT
jgi:hypothetical protein